MGSNPHSVATEMDIGIAPCIFFFFLNLNLVCLNSLIPLENKLFQDVFYRTYMQQSGIKWGTTVYNLSTIFFPYVSILFN